MEGDVADCHMMLRMIGQIKVSSGRFRCVFVVFLYVTKAFSLQLGLYLTRKLQNVNVRNKLLTTLFFESNLLKIRHVQTKKLSS